jgi:hypothetical protein
VDKKPTPDPPATGDDRPNDAALGQADPPDAKRPATNPLLERMRRVDPTISKRYRQKGGQ